MGDEAERERAERDGANARAALEALDQGWYRIEAEFDADGDCVDLLYLDENPAAVAMTGRSFVGERLSELGAYEPLWLELFGDVARTGRTRRERRYAEPDGKWYDFQAFKPEGAGARELHVVFRDATAERAALEASEDRHAFLLRLNDAVRRLSDPAAVQRAALGLVADHLSCGIAYYVEVQEERGRAVIEHDVVRPGLPSMVGEYPLEAYAWCLPLYRQGEPVVVPDVSRSALIPEPDRAAMLGVGLAAFIGVPLVKGGRFVGTLCAAEPGRRDWSGAEVRLLQDCAERIWSAIERARAEAELRDSEARFRSFAEASADALWIYDAVGRRLEYLSPAFERLFGESRDRVQADIGRWAELVHPDDRAFASEALPAVLAGRTWVQEYRITRPADGAVRWIRDTGFPIHREGDRVTRVGGVAQDVTDHHRAADRQRLLLEELQHRVRNTLGVVRSVARRTALTSDSVEDYALHLDGRIEAFARTQAMLTRDPTAGVDLAALVAEELRAHAAFEGEEATIEGPSLALKPKAGETLGLAIHELATNAVKYGALSRPEGRLAVRWRIEPGPDGDVLALDWIESGAATAVAPPGRRGFGAELLERTLAYELKAETRLDWRPEGLRCAVRVPLGPKVLHAADV